MKSISYWFMGLAALFALVGMGFGIWMSMVQDFTLAPAHAHNNLIGFVSLTIYGVFYRLVPAAASTVLARVHFWVALVGAVTFGPGLILVLTNKGEWLVQIASVATILGMAIFAWTVFSNRSALTAG